MDGTAGKLDTLQSVELAEGVEIHLRVAGPMLRISAYLIDLLIIGGVLLGVSMILVFGSFVIGDHVGGGLWLLMYFILSWWYPVILEAGRRGATFGKRAMGLRVVQTSGAPITVGQAIIRNFLRVVDSLPGFSYGFGLASCMATRRFQRLGDLAAGTVVVYDTIQRAPRVNVPPSMQPLAPPVALTADETRALVTFRERSGLWSEGRRIEMSDHLSELSGSKGSLGVQRVMAMAHWLQEKRRQ